MISEKLADFAVNARPTEEDLAMMRLSLFDWAVCGYAGRMEPVSGIVHRMAVEEGTKGQCTLIGSRDRVPARAAALVNGTISHALDYDDTHFAHIGHPSVAVVPAALALSERDDVDGVVFLNACIIGAETSIRVGRWLGRGHYDRGFHMTGTAGAFGAAAAAGHVLCLDVDQVRHALGIAATRAAGLKSQFGTMGKPYAAGLAAQTGVEAAILASSGFVSRPDGLECAQGFGPTHGGAAEQVALEGLGETWDFDRVAHKFHACCHGTHAALEALISLSRRIDGNPVDHVTITVNPSWLSVCNIETPKTGLEAKFSYRMTAAMVLDGQDTAMLDTFDDAACGSARLKKLAARVSVVGNAAMAVTAAQVSVRMADGRKLQADHDLDTPLALPDRANRLRGKARAMLGDSVVQPIWDAITFCKKPDLPTLTACLGGSFPETVAASA